MLGTAKAVAAIRELCHTAATADRERGTAAAARGKPGTAIAVAAGRG